MLHLRALLKVFDFIEYSALLRYKVKGKVKVLGGMGKGEKLPVVGNYGDFERDCFFDNVPKTQLLDNLPRVALVFRTANSYGLES